MLPYFGKRYLTINAVIKILIVFLLIPGCTTGVYQAPVGSRAQPPSESISHHIVSKGETLYSIAWRYGLDYKALAQANGINSSRHIYPGQRLSLNLPDNHPVSSSVKQTVSSAPHSGKKDQTKKVVKAPTKSDSSRSFFWNWPARGKLYQRFSSSGGLKKGIDILGEKGDPVFAAAPGYVVYAGEGLRGYGKLLIIKHNDVYLSAYAHNHKILVKEGDKE